MGPPEELARTLLFMSATGYVAANANKENLIDKMPKLFLNKEEGDRTEFSRPPSATTNQRISRPQSSMLRQQKVRGLASRPTTANTRSTTSMSGGKLLERNGDKFVVCQSNKPTGYKKFPAQTATHFVSTSMASYIDPSSSLRGKKRLEPYRPESARSRLPVHFKGEPKPHIRHCQATNMSNFSIGAPDTDWERLKRKAAKRKRPVSAT